MAQNGSQGEQHRVISVRGEIIELWATAEDTGGSLCVAMVTTFPKNGPAPHIHHREAELFYVLEGKFSFRSGTHTMEANPGSVCYVPKHTVHTYQNIGDTPGKALVVLTPGGFESFWMEVADLVPNPAGPSGPPSPETVARLLAAASKYGLEYERGINVQKYGDTNWQTK